MRQISMVLMLLILSLSSIPADAAQDIKVLVARTSGVFDSEALAMLGELNDLMNASSISSRDFSNANIISTYVAVASCPGSNHLTLLACAKTELASKRTQFNADIVLLLVPSLGSTTCGAVNNTMINLATIEVAHRGLGYAVISNACALVTGLYPTSHEVLHLLSIEHKRNDPKTYFPVNANDNHAATSGRYATAGAVPFDCTPNSCNKFENQVSATGATFQNGYSAGNSSHSNAKRVIQQLSWNVVSDYYPVPAPSCGSPNITVNAHQCNINGTRTFLITGSLPGYQITSARYEVKVGSYGIWQIILNGALSCPLFDSGFGFYVKMFFTTPQGTAVCQKYVTFPSCSGGGGGDPPIQPW